MVQNINCGRSFQMEFESEATYEGTFEGNSLARWYYGVLPDMEAAVQDEVNNYTANCVPVRDCEECTKRSETLNSGGLSIVPDKNDPTKGKVTVTVRVYVITNCSCKNKPSKAMPPKRKDVDWEKWLNTPAGRAYQRLKQEKIKFMKKYSK
jgi:hypothetical protein